MKTSDRTKTCKRLGIFFSVLNWILCFGLTIAFVVCFVSGQEPSDTTLKEKFGVVIYGIGLSLIPMIVLAIIVKDKVRPTIWMANIILANYLFGPTVMYLTFAVWLVSEYIIQPLANRYKLLYNVNKEIDRR